MAAQPASLFHPKLKQLAFLLQPKTLQLLGLKPLRLVIRQNPQTLLKPRLLAKLSLLKLPLSSDLLPQTALELPLLQSRQLLLDTFKELALLSFELLRLLAMISLQGRQPGPSVSTRAE